MTARGYECDDLSRTSGFDVGDEASVDRFFSELTQLDALVNNAAILELTQVIDMKVGTWDDVIRVGLRGAFLCSQAAFRLMKPGGTIVNVSSLSGVSGADKFPRMSAYVAAKSGLAGLTEVLAGRSPPPCPFAHPGNPPRPAPGKGPPPRGAPDPPSPPAVSPLRPRL